MAIIDSLVSYYKLDESSGSIADAHASNTGTYNGSLYSELGKINTSIGFDGSDDYIDLNAALMPATAIFSTNMWFKTSSASIQILWSQYPGTGWSLLFINGGEISYTNSGILSMNTTGQNLDDGAWHMVTFVYNGSGREIYVDGTSIFDDALGSSIIQVDTWIGKRDDGTPYTMNGSIDEFGIWSRALTSTEVGDLYNSGNGLAYPFSAATLRKIKIGGTFVDKPILTKVAGTFVDKPIKIKVGGTFQDA